MIYNELKTWTNVSISSMYFSLERMAWSADITSSIKFLLFPEKNVFQIFQQGKKNISL